MRDGPPAVVLGTGLTVLGAVRCLGREGVPVVVPTEQPAFVAASRWCGAPSPPGRLEDPEALPTYLERLSEEGEAPEAPRAVLLPCSDEWVHRVARLPPALRERFPASVPPDPVLEVLTDKHRFAEHLVSRELPHPRTWPAEGAADLRAAMQGTDTRLFLKPRHSLPFFRRFGMKAVMPDDPEDMCRALERFGEEGHPLLFQEYVPGPPSNHYFVDGFVDAGGDVRGLLVRRRLRMYPRNFGNSSYMVSVPPDEAADAVAVTRALLEDLGYRGVFSAEFKRDERDGTFRILEVNARPWIFVEFAARCGMDVCTMAYRDALDRSVPSVARYRTGRTLVQPYYDAQACLGAYRDGELPLARILRSWLGADLPAFAWDDPMPALRELMAWVGRFARQRLGPDSGRNKT